MLCFLRSPLSPCLCSRVIVLRFSKRLLSSACFQAASLSVLSSKMLPSPGACSVVPVCCVSSAVFTFSLPFLFFVRPRMHFGQFAQKTSLHPTRCSVSRVEFSHPCQPFPAIFTSYLFPFSYH